MMIHTNGDPRRKARLKQKKRERRRKRKEAAQVSSAVFSSFLRTPEWKRVRYKALMASNGRCECCGRGPAEGAVLNVDHIKPRHKFPELALDLSNLQVLCGTCNAGKGGWDETDWREPRLAVVMGERIG